MMGGGLLGIELAAALHEAGMNVTIVHRSSHLMSKQLDTTASLLLEEELDKRGIRVLLNTQVQNYSGDEFLLWLRLNSGELLECDGLIVATGTTPNLDLALAAGLQCHRGVVVNAHLQTSDPKIFAVGEIAQFGQMMYGITEAAEEQATVAARFIAGDPGACYTQSLNMHIVKVDGLDLCALGEVNPSTTLRINSERLRYDGAVEGVNVADHRSDYQEIIVLDRSRRYYKKCLIHEDRLVGAILMGDKNELAEFKELIQTRMELGEKRKTLLPSGVMRDYGPVLGPLVCSCNHVGEGNITAVIEQGCADLGDLCRQSGAGIGCGSCKPEVSRILRRATENKSCVIPAPSQFVIPAKAGI